MIHNNTDESQKHEAGKKPDTGTHALGLHVAGGQARRRLIYSDRHPKAIRRMWKGTQHFLVDEIVLHLVLGNKDMDVINCHISSN